MEIKKTTDGKTITLAVSGRLDTSTAPAFDAAVDEVLCASPTALILDLKELEYTSSAGLRTMLKAQKAMNKLGSMKLINVCDDVREVLDITGFLNILSVE